MPTAMDTKQAPPEPVGSAKRWTMGRVAAVTAVMVTVIFWTWILAGGPNQANSDRIADTAFAQRTEARCTVFTRELAQLPNPTTIKTPVQRADVLDRANDDLTAMVDDIAADAPKTGHDAKPVADWLTDWRLLIQDRRDYARRLRIDRKARFYVSHSPAVQAATATVDDTISTFATQANNLTACDTPGDVG